MSPRKAIHKEEKPALSRDRYVEALGGRKTAHARVRLTPKQHGIVINGKPLKEYFKETRLQNTVMQPMEVTATHEKVGATVIVRGGGITGQAEAVRHGIARALTLFDADLRKRLRHEGFLTRDARMVERKKYGLKKARRAPQWAKR
ncbi:MAG: 30S ribosomal protein S9 [bacterium]|nr:30S ribosomal protein S9 [bacterium]